MRSLVRTTLAATLLVSAPATALLLPHPVAAEEAPPQKMQLVLDASGSMKEPAARGTKIAAARAALTQVVDTLPEDASVGLRVYGATVDSGAGACTDSQQVVAPGTDNRAALHDAISAYRPLGETPIGYALQQAGKDLGTEGKRTIVLVSDGEPTCDPDPCKVARELSQDGIDLKIDVVGLSVDAKTRKRLRCIADAGNGTYYDADSAESLTKRLQVTSTRAFRPFDLTGEPIAGSEDAATAPTFEAGTTYLDKIPPKGKVFFYRIERTVPGSTIHVGTTARTTAGSIGDGLAIKLYDESDPTTPCVSSGFGKNTIGARRPLLTGGVDTWSTDPEDRCTTATSLLVGVEISIGNELANTPFELTAYEEPPLEDGTDRTLPPVTEGASWTPLEPGTPTAGVAPGTSLSNAPVLESGTYALDIQSGETQVFAVPVAWGQNLQVQIDAELSDKAVDSAGAWSGFGAEIHGPVREENTYDLSGDEPEDWTKTAFGNLAYERAYGDVKDHHYRTGAMTAPVEYLNRSASNPTIKGTALTGYRYVEVNYSVMDDGITVPYELTVKVNGDEAGTPQYAGDGGLATPSTDGVAAPEDEAQEADTTDVASSTVDGGVPVLGIVLAAGGALLLVGGLVTTVLVLNGRRRPIS